VGLVESSAVLMTFNVHKKVSVSQKSPQPRYGITDSYVPNLRRRKLIGQ
jgi:hypothetical protein